jgi:hypothetical protein
MVHQLTVLGSAAIANTAGQAGRTLRTIVASQAHLPTLGSTPPAGRTPCPGCLGFWLRLCPDAFIFLHH